VNYSYVIVENRGHIAYITLNRPERRNALSIDMMNELITAFKEARANDEIRVVVLKGAGEKAFCAGGDLAGMHAQIENGVIAVRQFTSKYAEFILAVEDLSKPIIAAVKGFALAGGFGLAAACDLTIASEDAIFGAPEINIGFWGGIIAAPIVRVIGMKRTMELFYTGQTINAEEAYRIGIVNKVVANSELEKEVDRLAEVIASKSPTAINMGREAFYTIRDMDYRASVKHLREVVTILANSPETREGMSGFLNKNRT